MSKNDVEKIYLVEVDYDNVEDDVFKIMEDLYLNNHSTPDHLLEKKLPRANYVLVFEKDTNNIIGMTSYKDITKKLAMIERSILFPEYRGIGLGSAMSWAMEDLLKKKGFTKLTCEVFTFNLTMIILKLKQGYEIEGRAVDHDEMGVNQYYLGKVIGD